MNPFTNIVPNDVGVPLTYFASKKAFDYEYSLNRFVLGKDPKWRENPPPYKNRTNRYKAIANTLAKFYQ